MAGLGPALEVIDLDTPIDDLERVMAANVFHRAVVLGPVTQGCRSVEGLHGALPAERRAMSMQSRSQTAAMAPGAVMALVSGYLDAVGDSLQPGDVIIAGSLVTALPAAAGRFELQVDTLGSVALELTSA